MVLYQAHQVRWLHVTWYLYLYIGIAWSMQGDPLWSARLLNSDPALLQDIHLSFLRHGAQIITTASYQVGGWANVTTRLYTGRPCNDVVDVLSTGQC